MSFQVISKATVLSEGQPILDLAVDDGSAYTVGRAQLIRRTCALILTDPNETLVASTANDVLTPYGNEIALYQGVRFDDGSEELILVGIFQIVDRLVDDSGADLTINLGGADRSRAIQRDLFTDVFIIPPNTNVGLAIQSIVLSRNISPLAQQFNFAPTEFLTPSTPIVYNPGDDPLAAIADPNTGLAASIGMQFFYDPNGIATLIPIPDPTTQPVSWVYDADAVPNSSIATDWQPTLTSVNAYNVVVREGTGSGVGTPSATAQDDDPGSPMWVGGDYGSVVDYQSSSLLTSDAQCLVAAQAALRVNLGSVKTLQFSAIPKPDTDVDDVVQASRIRAGIAPDSLYVLDSFTSGLGWSGVTQHTGRFVA